MKCERSYLRDSFKHAAIAFIGGRMDIVAEVEAAVDRSHFAASSKRKWHRNFETWKTRREGEAAKTGDVS